MSFYKVKFKKGYMNWYIVKKFLAKIEKFYWFCIYYDNKYVGWYKLILIRYICYNSHFSVELQLFLFIGYSMLKKISPDENILKVFEQIKSRENQVSWL